MPTCNSSLYGIFSIVKPILSEAKGQGGKSHYLQGRAAASDGIPILPAQGSTHPQYVSILGYAGDIHFLHHVSYLGRGRVLVVGVQQRQQIGKHY